MINTLPLMSSEFFYYSAVVELELVQRCCWTWGCPKMFTLTAILSAADVIGIEYRGNVRSTANWREERGRAFLKFVFQDQKKGELRNVTDIFSQGSRCRVQSRNMVLPKKKLLLCELTGSLASGRYQVRISAILPAVVACAFHCFSLFMRIPQ
jgi:hypothetical protein